MVSLSVEFVHSVYSSSAVHLCISLVPCSLVLSPPLHHLTVLQTLQSRAVNVEAFFGMAVAKVVDGHYRAVDGFRAVVHLSLVALHCAMLASAHLPSEGPVWQAVRKHPLYSVAQAGGVQVDLMFMLSAFLLVHKLLVEFDKGKAGQPLFAFTIRRALRFIPPMLAVSVLGYLLHDTWDGAVERGEVSPLVRVLSFVTFVANYIPPAVVGCFTLSLCWSCCVDLHAGVILNLIGTAAKTGLGSSAQQQQQNSPYLAYRLRWIFLALTAASVAVRAWLFEVNSLNLFRLGQYSHFGLLMTDSSYGWIQEHFGHTWKTKNTQVELAQGYMTKMYNPTHTRIGPFFVGAVVACNVFLAARVPPKQRTLLGAAASWVFTLLALVQLIVPCLPPDDDVPVIGQHIATAALRTLSSAAAGFLLYRCLVPKEHGWHWGALNSVLSWRAFAPIATLSYCSYLVHFRVIMELNFRPNVHSRILSILPLRATPSSQAELYIEYIPKLFVLATVGSLLVSAVLYWAVEKPAAALLAGIGGRRKKVD